jgi:hypothetical protein
VAGHRQFMDLTHVHNKLQGLVVFVCLLQAIVVNVSKMFHPSHTILAPHAPPCPICFPLAVDSGALLDELVGLPLTGGGEEGRNNLESIWFISLVADL